MSESLSITAVWPALEDLDELTKEKAIQSIQSIKYFSKKYQKIYY